MSHLSRIKNPCFAMSVRSSSPAGLQLRPILLGCSNSLGTTASFLSLSKTRVHYVLARPCQLIAIRLVFHILTIPCMLSLIDHCQYALPPPPKSHRRRKGDLSVLTTVILTAGYIVLCFGYLLCLGPS